MRAVAAVGLLLMCLPGGRARAEQSSPPAVAAAPSPDSASIAKPWTGDLDGMIKRRQIRVLVPYSKTHHFIDKGVQRGVTYDALKEFETQLNTKLKTGNLRVHVVFLPTSRDKLQAALLEGRGDIVAANVTQTIEREKIADFATPTYKDSAIDKLDKGLFAFASYNAGPGRLRQLRAEAQKTGLDPNVWFNNVERVAAKRIGRETVQYVSNIYKYYVAYQLAYADIQARRSTDKR